MDSDVAMVRRILRRSQREPHCVNDSFIRHMVLSGAASTVRFAALVRSIDRRCQMIKRKDLSGARREAARGK